MPTKTANTVNRAISIRQPWAERILQGKKKREYRSRVTNIRGRVPTCTRVQRLTHLMHVRGNCGLSLTICRPACSSEQLRLWIV